MRRQLSARRRLRPLRPARFMLYLNQPPVGPAGTFCNSYGLRIGEMRRRPGTPQPIVIAPASDTS